MRKKNVYRRRCRTCRSYFTAYNIRREFCPDTNCDDIYNNAKKWLTKLVENFGYPDLTEIEERVLAKLCTGSSASVQRYMLDVYGFGFNGKRMEPNEVFRRFHPEYHYKRFVLREITDDRYIIIRTDNG